MLPAPAGYLTHLLCFRRQVARYASNMTYKSDLVSSARCARNLANPSSIVTFGT